MTVNRIRDAAIYHFSKYGYEGTSLADIAQHVGIKKPSLYAHYKNKEEIFFCCLDYALQSSIGFLQQFIHNHQQLTAERLLYQFLNHYQQQASDHGTLMFCLRTLYFPPYPFREQVIERANKHIAAFGQLLSPLFAQAQAAGLLRDVDVDRATEAYLCLFDGLMVELMYAGAEGFQYRLEAAWRIFVRGLFHVHHQ